IWGFLNHLAAGENQPRFGWDNKKSGIRPINASFKIIFVLNALTLYFLGIFAANSIRFLSKRGAPAPPAENIDILSVRISDSSTSHVRLSTSIKSSSKVLNGFSLK